MRRMARGQHHYVSHMAGTQLALFRQEVPNACVLDGFLRVFFAKFLDISGVQRTLYPFVLRKRSGSPRSFFCFAVLPNLGENVLHDFRKQHLHLS
jgi:hypothetical protein